MSKEEVEIFLENKLNLQLGISSMTKGILISGQYGLTTIKVGKTINTYTQNVKEDQQYTQEGYYLLLYRRCEFSL